MSKSTKGTKKTTSFIDDSSSKYVDRKPTGQGKKGTAGQTDASHIMSFGLANTILTHTPGRPKGEKAREDFVRDMNHDSNLRIKTSHGNKVLDERRDARIAKAFVSDSAIKGNTTATRAYQAYTSAKSFTTMDSLSAALGNMKVYSDETGRSHKLRNHEKYVK